MPAPKGGLLYLVLTAREPSVKPLATATTAASGGNREELFAIARRYHVSPGQMLAANDLPDGTARLDEARRLLVPGV